MTDLSAASTPASAPEADDTEFPRHGWRGWYDLAMRVKSQATEDHLALLSAGIAFYGLLAVFPALAFAMSLAGILTEPTAVVEQLEAVGQVLPGEARNIILTQAREVTGSAEDGLGLAALISLALALWSSSRGMNGLIEGLNVAYGLQEKRGFVRLTLTNLALTFGVMLGFVLVLTLIAVIPAALSVVHASSWIETAVDWLRWPILALIAMFGLTVIYRLGPSRETFIWRWLTTGSVLACLLWLLGSLAFSYYVGEFASYNKTFGTLAGAIIMMTWLWLSAFIVLLGAEVNCQMSERRRRRRAARSRGEDAQGLASD